MAFDCVCVFVRATHRVVCLSDGNLIIIIMISIWNQWTSDTLAISLTYTCVCLCECETLSLNMNSIWKRHFPIAITLHNINDAYIMILLDHITTPSVIWSRNPIKIITSCHVNYVRKPKTKDNVFSNTKHLLWLLESKISHSPNLAVFTINLNFKLKSWNHFDITYLQDDNVVNCRCQNTSIISLSH